MEIPGAVREWKRVRLSLYVWKCHRQHFLLYLQGSTHGERGIWSLWAIKRSIMSPVGEVSMS